MSGDKNRNKKKHFDKKGSSNKGNSKKKIKEDWVKMDDGVSSNKESKFEKPYPINIVVQLPEDKWSIANWIALGSGIVALAYFIATFYILQGTNKAVAISDSLFFETKREFDIANDPQLVLGGGIGLSNWRNKDSFSIVTFRIHNLSRLPIQIEKAIYGIRYDTIDPMNIFKESDSNLLMKKDNSHIIADVNVPRYHKFDGVIRNTDVTIKSMIKGINTFFGVICYRNYLARNKRRYYVFSVRIAPNKPAGDHEIVQRYFLNKMDSLPNFSNAKYKDFFKDTAEIR